MTNSNCIDPIPPINRFARDLTIAVVDLATMLQTSGATYNEVINQIYDLISQADKQRDDQIKYMQRLLNQMQNLTDVPYVIPKNPQDKP